MFSILSLLSGAALAGLVYGFSFLPSATLARCDDIECTDEDRTKSANGAMLAYTRHAGQDDTT